MKKILKIQIFPSRLSCSHSLYIMAGLFFSLVGKRFEASDIFLLHMHMEMHLTSYHQEQELLQ